MTGYETLEAAVAAVEAEATAVITVNEDVTVTSYINVSGGRNITIRNRAGADVTITDGVTNTEPKHSAATILNIQSTAQVTLTGNTTGSLTFQGVVTASTPAKRTMFTLPQDNAGQLTINNGVIVQGHYSSNGAGVIRDYGTVIINGGTFKDNAVASGNGSVIFLGGAGSATINGGTFQNNNANNSNGGLFQVSNDAGHSTLTINDGTFTGNAGKLGAVVNSYANSVVTINGGTFTGNKGYNSTADANHTAAVYCQGTFTITGGTFTGNTTGEGTKLLYDVYVNTPATVTIGDGATIEVLGPAT
jgi:hypothetical protein